MNFGQVCQPCRESSCSLIPGRGCFGDLPGDETVVSPPSPIVEPLFSRHVASRGIQYVHTSAPRRSIQARAGFISAFPNLSLSLPTQPVKWQVTVQLSIVGKTSWRLHRPLASVVFSYFLFQKYIFYARIKGDVNRKVSEGKSVLWSRSVFVLQGPSRSGERARFVGRFSGMHRALDGWMLDHAPASAAQDLYHLRPQYFNFPCFCMTWCVALRNLGLLIKTDWGTICPICC